MYGVKIENQTIIFTNGTNKDLVANGYTVCKTKEEQQIKGNNMLRFALRKEFNSMSVSELHSERAKELEKALFWADPDYQSGAIIQKRIQALQNK